MGKDNGPENRKKGKAANLEAREHMQLSATAPQQEKDVEHDPMGRGSGDISKPLDSEATQWENTVPNAESQAAAAERSEPKHFHIHPTEDEPHFANALEYQHPEQPSEVPKAYEDTGNTILSLEQEIAMLKQLADRERNEFDRKLRESDLKIQKLNRIIIKQSSQLDEPDDDQIKNQTREIRRLVQSIIRDNYGSEILHDTAMAKSTWPQELLELFPRCSRKGLLYLLMSHMFNLLNQHIFNVNCFGLDHHMEVQMGRFEEMVTAVDSAEAVEWSRRTVSCALRLPANVQDRAHYVSKVLHHFLAPLKITRITTGPKAHDRVSLDQLLDSSLFNLCTKAIKLALRFRASSTTYAFRAYKAHTKFAVCDQSLVEKLGFEGRVSEPEDPKKQKILGTVFGALVKTRNSAIGSEPGVVLLEGQVIVYEKLPPKEISTDM